MFRVLSMIATSLAIAPATATCGSATIASEALILLNLTRARWGSRPPDRRERVERGDVAVVGVPLHAVHPERGIALDRRSDVDEGRPRGIGPPERELSRGGLRHERTHRVVVRADHGRRAGGRGRARHVEPGPD